MNLDEREITVGELKKLFNEIDNNEYEIEIDTPDGWQKITAWYDKGKLPMVKIILENGMSTICATNHKIESIRKLNNGNPRNSKNIITDGPTTIIDNYKNGKLINSSWIFAEDLYKGDYILTVNNKWEKIIDNIPVEDQECYDFTVDHPNHRYWGDGISSHNSGKSYFVSANMVKDCQKQGIFPIIIDTENAIEKAWLERLGVDAEDGIDQDTGMSNKKEPKLERVVISEIETLSKYVHSFIDDYKSNYSEVPKTERPKIAIIIDSIGMTSTETMMAQAEEGTMQGDMGIKAKKITHMIRTLMTKISNENIGIIFTNHTYASQDKYSPDSISGGKMLEYASSIIIQMNKLLLKEDEDGVKLAGGEVAGIRSSVVVRKSRYNKPFEKLFVNIPYDTGMDEYSGMFDLCYKKGVLVKDGTRYIYTCKDGSTIKKFKKDYGSVEWEKIINEWDYEKVSITETAGYGEFVEPDEE